MVIKSSDGGGGCGGDRVGRGNSEMVDGSSNGGGDGSGEIWFFTLIDGGSDGGRIRGSGVRMQERGIWGCLSNILSSSYH